jgi:hypothetical protein
MGRRAGQQCGHPRVPAALERADVEPGKPARLHPPHQFCPGHWSRRVFGQQRLGVHQRTPGGGGALRRQDLARRPAVAGRGVLDHRRDIRPWRCLDVRRHRPADRRDLALQRPCLDAAEDAADGVRRQPGFRWRRMGDRRAAHQAGRLRGRRRALERTLLGRGANRRPDSPRTPRRGVPRSARSWPSQPAASG